MKWVAWPLIWLLVCAGPAFGATEMAITVDDLPAHGALPAGTTRLAIAERMIRVLKQHAVPGAYGFLNAGQIDTSPEHGDIVKAWVGSGFNLGNHTYSHMDINRVPVAEYVADIARNEPLGSTLGGPRWFQVFRYPFLHEGDALDKRNAVRQWLVARGYAIAQVTIYFDDWAWNDPYARCVARGDEQAIAWLKESFMEAARSRLAWSRVLSHMLFGRQVKHIVLLHMGAFDALMLDDLLRAYRRAGMKAIRLETAMRDSAYALNPDIVWDGEMTFLLQIAQARRIPIPPDPKIPLERLDALCR